MAFRWWWAWTLLCWVCMSCREWNVIQGPCNFALLHVSEILFTWAHEVGIKYSRRMTIFMLQIFCTQSLPVFQNDQKIPYNIAPLSSAWLIPMCDILSHRKLLYLQVSSQWGYIRLKHDSGESNKTVGNGIFHSGRLVSLCYWAQQSKAAERVLDTQFQPFQRMQVYNFLVMVYSLLGRGLLMIASCSWKASSASTS